MKEVQKALVIIIVASALFCKIMFVIIDGYPKAASEPTPIPNYLELVAVDAEGMELETFEGPGFQIQCPAGEWETVEESVDEYSMLKLKNNRLMLFNKETIYNENTIGFSIDKIGESTPLLKSELEKIEEAYFDMPGWTISESEMYIFDGMTIGCIDLEMIYTEEMLDEAVADGYITEEFIELVGGREVYLSAPAVREFTMGFTKDGYFYIMVGIYYTSEQKAVILDAMTIALQTLEPTE